MQTLFKVLGGCFVLAIGAGVVVIGDNNGWFRKEAAVQNEISVQDEKPCPHGLTSTTCAFCDESLIEKLGFCKGHEVPEAFCTQCNSALIVAFKSVNDWCEEHNLPESQCKLCNPQAEENGGDEATTIADQSPSIKLVTNKNILRNQKAPSVTCTTESLKVQFLSPQTAKKAGLEYDNILEKDIVETISCNTEIGYDENRFARLSSRASGVIADVKKDLGNQIKQGDILATIDSSDFGTAKSEYLQANAIVKLWEKNYDREKGLLEKSASTERDVLEAGTKLTESKIKLSRSVQRLKNLGIGHDSIKEIAEKSNTSTLLPLTAPFDGTIVERDAVIGEVVTTSQVLFAVSDTSRVWANLDVYENDAIKILVGMTAIIDIESLLGRRHGGKVTWVSSHFDPKTRTLKARVELPNPKGFLKAGMFGKATVSIKDKTPSLVVPKSAVQWEGCCNVVFVRLSDYVFEPRKISIEYAMERHYVISGNVKPNETVVTTGSFLLKTEVLKGSIGAGCCEVEPGK